MTSKLLFTLTISEVKKDNSTKSYTSSLPMLIIIMMTMTMTTIPIIHTQQIIIPNETNSNNNTKIEGLTLYDFFNEFQRNAASTSAGYEFVYCHHGPTNTTVVYPEGTVCGNDNPTLEEEEEEDERLHEEESRIWMNGEGDENDD